jgi:2-dehydropantoate 2-reductase
LRIAFPGPVLVMGAGSVGCYLGGRLAAAGAELLFVGRPRMLDALATHGLTITDLDGAQVHLPAASLQLAAEPPAGVRPALVLLCVKSGATAEAARLLGERLPPGSLVLSMQNGISNAALAAAQAPGLRLLPGMVPYNIAELAPGHLHRGTAGALAAQDDPVLRPWVAPFQAAGLPLVLHPDLRPVQWGKLLLNLNNPVNALSGLPLRAELLERGYRRCFAALIDEALGVLAAAGIVPARVTALPPRWLPAVLRLPTPVFRRLAARMLRIDAQAGSSMADDLALGRRTEVDALCGEVVRLATRVGAAAPMNSRVRELLDDPAALRLPMSPARLRAVISGKR